MALLIDGYNLLFASGVFGVERGARGGESSRRALLDQLADLLPPAEAARTTIVFDAADAPPGLPRQFAYRGLDVRFTPRKVEADELLETLIEQARDPRRLTVVSSDHRLQRAARRRQARYADSEVWWQELQRSQQAPPPSDEDKPGGTLPPDEVHRWLSEFGLPPDRRKPQD